MAPTTRRMRTAPAVITTLLVAGCGANDGPSQRARPPAPPQQLPTAAPEYVGATANVPIARLPDQAWLARTAQRTGIPERVLAAYAGASLRMADVDPSCGVGWNTLAGIGATESAHGSHRGARVNSNGVVEPSIIGVPLNGGEGVLEIPDSDQGELDGDTEWDRAVGPMQFIPQTWQYIGVDGNRDGDANPHQIDDASLTAAVYLCESGGDLTSDQGWNAAVNTYNPSAAYARQVADRADNYAEEPAPTGS